MMIRPKVRLISPDVSTFKKYAGSKMVMSEKKHLYCLHHITEKFVIEMYVTSALYLLLQHQC